MPWSQYGELLNRTAALWRGASSAQARLLCQGPPCENCAHTPAQLACVVDVEVQAAAGSFDATSCWPKCSFAKGSVPDVPQTCWR